ncbi:MAG: hypothetical protein IJW73_04640, partial [Candidatus Gastranaerophilales bacterium]|nr:hypothetical protein [Candidatus Gastranaerophilales bacterium]
MEQKKKEKIELIKKSFELKNLKKYKEALEMLYKALEYDCAQEDNAELLSQIGDLHILLNNNERALDEFQRALTVNKNHSYSIQKCFDIYYDTDQTNKALRLARAMCEENKTPQSYVNYLKALIKLDKIQDALEIFNGLHENIKLDTNVLYLISTISGDKKQGLLEKIITIDEFHPQANLDLAKIEFQKGNYDKVVSYCLNVDEKNPLAIYYLGMVEYQRKKYTSSIDFFVKAIELDDNKHDFYFDLAKAYIEISWLDEALLTLKKSINLNLNLNKKEKLDERYLLSGWILIRQNQLQKAILNLNAIGKDSDSYKDAQILIQTINLKNSNIAKAKLELEKYYKNDEKDLIIIDALALLYKELGQTKKALDMYDKGLKIQEDSIYYTLEKIDLLIDLEDYEKANILIEKTSEKYSNCANIYNSLARIHYRLKDLNSALWALNKYLELDKNKAEVHYFKGLVL